MITAYEIDKTQQNTNFTLIDPSISYVHKNQHKEVNNYLLESHQDIMIYDNLHSTRHSVFKIHTLSNGVSHGGEEKSDMSGT